MADVSSSLSVVSSAPVPDAAYARSDSAVQSKRSSLVNEEEEEDDDDNDADGCCCFDENDDADDEDEDEDEDEEAR